MLEEYSRIATAFWVDRILDVSTLGESGLGGLLLTERTIEAPYEKNYDVDGAAPASWASRFDISRWAFVLARIDNEAVGGAAVAFEMLEGRDDLRLLWDIRVDPNSRRRGIGSALLVAAEHAVLARARGSIRVETQNINVAACRFYASHGYVLEAVRRFAYRALPNETQLLWYKRLSAP